MVRSLWAWSATASAACVAPAVRLPGGKPVIALPGLTPRSPKIVVGPVLVTVWPPRTAKLAAEPSPGAVWPLGLAMAPDLLPENCTRVNCSPPAFQRTKGGRNATESLHGGAGCRCPQRA